MSGLGAGQLQQNAKRPLSHLGGSGGWIHWRKSWILDFWVISVMNSKVEADVGYLSTSMLDNKKSPVARWLSPTVCSSPRSTWGEQGTTGKVMRIMEIRTRERWGGTSMMSGKRLMQSHILRKEHITGWPYILQKFGTWHTYMIIFAFEPWP